MRAAYRIAFIGATALAFALAIGLGVPASPVEQAAKALMGERWHQVELGGRPVGQFVTRGTKAAGAYRFETHLAFRVDAGPETRIDSALAFDTAAPHPLTSASHVVNNGTGTKAVDIARNDAGRVTANADGTAVALDWDYALADYVALETWLGEARTPGARHTTRSVDFDRLALNKDVWQVAAVRTDGYSLRRRTPFGAAEVELRADFSFARLDIADWFSLRRVPDARAVVPWRSVPAFGSEPLRIPIDKPLDPATGLKRLVLRVHGDEDLQAMRWPALQRDADGRLSLARGGEAPEALTQADSFVAATVAHPAGNAEIQRLAAAATRDVAAPSAQAEALTRFVSGFIAYAEADGAQSVTQTLKTRRGDCTAYADLLTTLARASGLPARTVTGLAYAQGTFAVHNWTEIGIDGFWRGFDPTWGRVRLDATHIPLPHDGELAALDLLDGLRFELVSAEYEGGPA